MKYNVKYSQNPPEISMQSEIAAKDYEIQSLKDLLDAKERALRNQRGDLEAIMHEMQWMKQ